MTRMHPEHSKRVMKTNSLKQRYIAIGEFVGLPDFTSRQQCANWRRLHGDSSSRRCSGSGNGSGSCCGSGHSYAHTRLTSGIVGVPNVISARETIRDRLANVARALVTNTRLVALVWRWAGDILTGVNTSAHAISANIVDRVRISVVASSSVGLLLAFDASSTNAHVRYVALKCWACDGNARIYCRCDILTHTIGRRRRRQDLNLIGSTLGDRGTHTIGCGCWSTKLVFSIHSTNGQRCAHSI
jgi:hypothetical protein